MLGKKCQVRRRGIVGKAQRFTSMRPKIVGDAALRQIGFELWRKQESKIVVECNESTIKSGGVQTRETKPIADI